MNAYASLYLDTRRPSARNGNKYPVKIKVSFTQGKKHTRVYYPCKVYLNEKDFNRIIKAPRTDEQDIHQAITSALNKAIRIINKVKNITPQIFNQLYKGNDINSFSNYMNVVIKELEQQGRAGYVMNYTYALKSFEVFNKGTIYFNEITTDWLQRYEADMLKKHTITTVGMYTRALRAVLNKAVHANIITADAYPFGKGRYQIKTERKIKIPLSDKQIKKLKDYKPKDHYEARALAFWFLSYYCNGMNMIDILHLRHSDIVNDYIIFDRQKTRRTKTEVRKILIPMRPELQQIITRFGKHTLNPKDYLFDVIDDNADVMTKRLRVKDFAKRINKKLKNIGNACSIDKLTMGIARHTFANRLLNAGLSTDYLQYALGHSNVSTTEHYKGSFALEKIKKASSKL